MAFLFKALNHNNKAKHSNEAKIVVSGVVIVYEYTLLSRGFFCCIPCTYQ
jgi:hypothetical protein